MKIILRAVFAAIILLCIVAGCGDDDGCPVCPTDPADQLSITGLIMFGGGFNVYAALDIQSISGETWPEIDSLTIIGRKVDLKNDYYNDTPMFQVREYIDSPVYSAGDTIDIVAFTPFGVDICRIQLLDYYDDRVSFYDWPSAWPFDTVDVGEGFEVAWSSDQLADGYRLRATYLYDSTGWNVRDLDTYRADTVLTVEPEENGYNGYWLVYVAPATGMRPDGRVASASGAGAVGWNVACRTEYSELTIYVGTGDPGGDI